MRRQRAAVADPRDTHAWPKVVPDLSPEQRRISDEFMSRWLNVLSTRYQLLERFNHGYASRRGGAGRTLEIGAGIGAHYRFERVREQDYFTIDIRPELVAQLRDRHPGVTAVVGDCQERMPFESGFFSRVLAIHVLEHLRDLPSALDEIARVLADDGSLVAVVPCEGGAAYGLGRRLSAQRLFEREFGQDYTWLIRSEHVNTPREIVREVRKRFTVEDVHYFPTRIPSTMLNLVIGVTARPRR